MKPIRQSSKYDRRGAANSSVRGRSVLLLSCRENVPKQIQVGSTVLVRLYDDREVEAKIMKIVDSILGRKVHIAFGAFALIVDEVQIVRTLRVSLQEPK